MPILVLGHGNEGTIRHLLSRLTERNEDYTFLDFAHLRQAKDLRIEYEADELEVTLERGESIRFSDYSSVYTRLYFDHGIDARDASVMHHFLMASTAHLESSSKLVVNKPSSGIGNANKYMHLLDLKRCGFDIPATHIVGDEDTYKDLVARRDEWVNKSISSTKTKAVSDASIELQPRTLNNCPSLFQERILGFDVRIHSVGTKLVPLKIENSSGEIDYRFDGDSNTYFAIEIPDHIERSCVEYCQRQNLEFCGFDFKVHEGRWTVLEANPMPGFDFFDKKLGNSISDELIDYLASGESAFSGQPGPSSLYVEKSRRPDQEKML